MSEHTTYEPYDAPWLADVPPLARMQVINAVNASLLAEIVDAAGGEVVLAPGFAERAGRPERIVTTRFLDDGSYRIWTVPMDPEHNHPGTGTRWERMKGPRRDGETLELYEVEDVDLEHATLVRIDPTTSERIPRTPAIVVRTDYLRRGVAGWRRWSLPPRLVEEGAGAIGDDGDVS